MNWHPSLRERGAQLAQDLAAADPDALRIAVGREVRQRLDELERGIRLYRAHSYRRAPSTAPVIWHDGTTRLLDYGAGRGGMPLLVVPSLINRAYILDLWPERSFVQALARAGYRPFLVDWDRPGEAERRFNLSDYIGGRLRAALSTVLSVTGQPPVVIGYCMGGLLALALAALQPRDVAGLMLLATPWDFHAEKPALARAVARSTAPWMPFFETLGMMPVDVLQGLFATLDPFLVVRKFCAFARLDATSDRAREFVALEDWLNDGVPLAAGVARECLLGWYGENTPGRGAWRVAGHMIDPGAIKVPTLIVVPEQDRIVPPLSARALAQAIPQATVLNPPLGHIGMVASRRAPTELWPQLTGWLAGRLAMREAAGL
ncbi:MAG TPA: alpha/beta fold hydrolase [Alphaproteobacteria bacterium]|nr:alpha/beta fold hydrolase [Alphaproteobacteria bacterium]